MVEMSSAPHWLAGFAGAVTVCDPEGVVLEMNEAAAQAYAASGGLALLGTSLLDCHPEPARAKFAEMLRVRQVNVYTIEKHGIRKLVYQTPWYRGGEYGGFVEVLLPLPAEMPHFVREG
jgi:hypothetical protein